MNRFVWTDRAKAELIQIDQRQALEILHALTPFGYTGQGDVRPIFDTSQLEVAVIEGVVGLGWA